MPHNVASDQGLHCLLTGFSIKNEYRQQNRPDTPKMTNGLVQHITVEVYKGLKTGGFPSRTTSNTVNQSNVIL